MDSRHVGTTVLALALLLVGLPVQADAQGFGTAWDLPIHAGVKIGF